jgi:hypothetical protein
MKNTAEPEPSTTTGRLEANTEEESFEALNLARSLSLQALNLAGLSGNTATNPSPSEFTLLFDDTDVPQKVARVSLKVETDILEDSQN